VQDTFIETIEIQEFHLWEKLQDARGLFNFVLEITARCNNNCRHCYINLPANDKKAKEKELTFSQIKRIIDQAADLGAMWCLINGGEPFLREDFPEIYLYLKQKGILVSVFTNATLITDRHIQLFKKYPPRDIEVTVYGVTKETYEKVTGKAGSFAAFMRGINLLLENNIEPRFKAMVLRSNFNQLAQIFDFCRQRTKDYFRFDQLLHLRFDGNKKKNARIRSERLSAEEIAVIEKNDPERFQAMQKKCNKFVMPEVHAACNHIFHCGAGKGTFTVSYDGFFRLCSSLYHPDCIYDLKRGSLRQAYRDFVLRVRDMRSNSKEFLEKCRACPIINLCLWCPAHSYLETRELDKPVDYFCEVAHARAASLKNREKNAPKTLLS
jgi:radical SAM protein with 4Fe4S-binding SPASM domain